MNLRQFFSAWQAVPQSRSVGDNGALSGLRENNRKTRQENLDFWHSVTLKEKKNSQTDYYLVNLSSNFFEDKMAKYYSV